MIFDFNSHSREGGLFCYVEYLLKSSKRPYGATTDTVRVGRIKYLAIGADAALIEDHA